MNALEDGRLLETTVIMNIDKDSAPPRLKRPEILTLKAGDMAKKPLVVPAQMLDELKMVRDRILAECGGKRRFSVGFASANRAEGATTVTLKLALVTCGADRKVIVVDASGDAGLTKLLGLEGAQGLAELAAGAPAGDTVSATAIENLAVVPAGASTDWDPAEADWSDIMGRLSPLADIVFLDLPPVLSSAVAPLAGAACDALAIVVAAHATRREAVQQAKGKIEYSGDVKLLGMILNRREYFIPGFLYRHA